MPRLPAHRALLAAHNFAERHVANMNGQPDAAAFDLEWDGFTKRNPNLSHHELQMIYAYATAALHYAPRKRWWARDSSNGMTFIPIEHEAIAMPRGLWAGRTAGNVDALTGAAAA